MSGDLPPVSHAFLDSVLPVVLVGGKSRRFGRDKLVEPWGGKLLVQHPIDTLRAVFGSRVKVVGACDPRIPPLADGVLQDRYPGLGPIGGITAALDFWNGPVFVLAGDMPEVSRADILRIVAAAEHNDGPAAVVAFADRLHPCFGFYHLGARPLLTMRIATGELRLADALPDRLVLPVLVSPRSAANVNSPGDGLGELGHPPRP